MIPELLRATEIPPWYRNVLDEYSRQDTQADEVERTMRHSREYIEVLSKVCALDVSHLANAQIILLNSPLTDAQALRFKGEHYIFLHRGLLSIVSFAAEAIVLMTVCGQIHSRITAKDLMEHGLGRWPSVDAVAGLSSALTYAYFMQPVKLPVLYTRDIGPRELSFVVQLTCSAELFAVLHEAAHIALGHLSGSPQASIVRNEFLLPETSSQEKDQELEADAHAFAALDRAGRSKMARGAFLYLRILGTTEFLTQRAPEGHHPMAINRVHAILHRFGSDLEEDARKMGEMTLDFLQKDYDEFTREVVDPKTGRIWKPHDKVRRLAFDAPPERASWLLYKIGLFARSFAGKHTVQT